MSYCIRPWPDGDISLYEVRDDRFYLLAFRHRSRWVHRSRPAGGARGACKIIDITEEEVAMIFFSCL